VFRNVDMERFKYKSIGFLILSILGLCLSLIGCQSSIDINPSMPIVTKEPQHVVLLLPLRGELKAISQAIQNGFQAANQATASSITMDILNTDNRQSIRALYLQAVQLGADLIIGPLLKSDLQALSKLSDIKLPVLTLNYLNSTQEIPANFYQFGLSPNDEAKQAAIEAKQQNLQSALVIVPDNTWGDELAKAFSAQWKALGGEIIDRLNYTESFKTFNQQIADFLEFQAPYGRRNDFNMIFLGASSEMGRHIHPLLSFYCIRQVPVYSTALIYDKRLPIHLNRDLDRIIFCDTPWNLNIRHIKPTLKKQLAKRHLNFEQYASYYALGIDAFEVAMKLHQLDKDETQKIQGASGILTLNQDRQIVRQLPSAQIKQGKLKTLSTLWEKSLTDLLLSSNNI